MQFPEGFLHGEILAARRVSGNILVKAAFAPFLRIPRHAHPHARFDFVQRGAFSETYGVCERSAEPSLLIYRPPGEPHGERFGSRGAVCLSVDLSPRWLEEMRRESVVLDGSADFRGGLLAHLCHRLVAEFHQRDDVAPLAIESILAGIAIEVARRAARAGEQHAPRWLGRVQELLHARFRERLTLGEVAGTAGVHPVHLARVFRQVYRCTVGEYVRRLRLESAVTLLATSAAPLSEVALAAGFCDQSHFTRLFRRHTGLTPAEYRALHRAR